MVIADWLIKSMVQLKKAGVDSPRRDALVLLEDTLRKDRAWVVTHPEYDIPEGKLQEVNRLIEKRLKREPLAYIRGKAWFYGRVFEVNSDVMIPRPESEAFIELLKQFDSDERKAESKKQRVLDIGTGSGCLAITAKLEFPHLEIIATDSSKKALDIAMRNAKKHKVDIKFLHGSMLDPLTAYRLPLTAIIANLPYVPKGLITSPEIMQEPNEALFSGADGLTHYHRFFVQIANFSQFVRKNQIKYVLTESLQNQHEKIIDLAQKAGYKLEKTDLLVQLFKKS